MGADSTYLGQSCGVLGVSRLALATAYGHRHGLAERWSCERAAPQRRNVTLCKHVQNNAYVVCDALVMLMTSYRVWRLCKSTFWREKFARGSASVTEETQCSDGVSLIYGMLNARKNERCKEIAKKHKTLAGHKSQGGPARTDARCFGQHTPSVSQTATPHVQRQVV